MTGSLSKDDVARYHRDGFFKPISVFSAERVKEIRMGIDAIERDYSTKDLPHDLTHYFRVNGEFVIPLLTDSPVLR